MAQFLLTEELTHAIESYEPDISKRDVLLKSPTINYQQLVEFYLQCQPTATLLELIRSTRLVIPKREREKTPKTKEFEESLRLLKLQEKEAQYQRLVNQKPAISTLYETKLDDDFSASKMHKEIKSHVTTIFNIFISVASVVYAIWYWTSSSWGLRDGYRVLLCLFFGILILLAEVVVYMSYLNKVEEAKRKERLKREVKKVIRTYTMT